MGRFQISKFWSSSAVDFFRSAIFRPSQLYASIYLNSLSLSRLSLSRFHTHPSTVVPGELHLPHDQPAHYMQKGNYGWVFLKTYAVYSTPVYLSQNRDRNYPHLVCCTSAGFLELPFVPCSLLMAYSLPRAATDLF